MKDKIWLTAALDEHIVDNMAEQLNISRITAKVLCARNINTVSVAREFFDTTLKFTDPMLLKDAHKAATRIISAIDNKEKIVVYGDYDVDGICSTALLYKFLCSIGATNISYYIPERDKEGYGFNIAALQHLCQEGTQLLISVDCGVSAVAEVATVADKLDIIITDHHKVPDVVPCAYAIVNPQQPDCEYPFKFLAGVGVTFKLCQAIYQLMHQDTQEVFDDLLELVALATVADIVPLQGENRALVARGLKNFADTDIIGLRELIRVAGCEGKNINAVTLGFALAPRINAAGRLKTADLAVELLLTDNKERAAQIALRLNEENTQRQQIEAAILDEACAIVAAKAPKTSIVIAKKDWNIGVIGIVASRLVDKFYLPTVIFSINSDGIARGSCRSIKALDIYKALDSIKHLFLHFGGHSQAAGLSLKEENLPEFERLFNEYIECNLTAEDFLPPLRIDCTLAELGQIDYALVKELERLEPFGFGNARPVFAIYNTKVAEKAAFTGGKHLRLKLQHDVTKEAIMWQHGYLAEQLAVGDNIDTAFYPEINVWQGNISVQLRLLDIKTKLTYTDKRFTDKSLNYLPECAIYTTSDVKGRLSYEQTLPPTTMQVVFEHVPEYYQFDYARNKINEFKRSLNVVFAFGEAEIKEKIKRLQEQAITRDKLKKFFFALKTEFAQTPQIALEDLCTKKWFSEFNIIYIQIFLQIELLDEKQGYLSLTKLPANTKRDLNSSEILTNINTEYSLQYEFLQSLLSKSMPELLRSPSM